MPGRSTRPLFDLLREGNAAASAPVRSVHIDTKPVVVASSARPAGRPASEKQAGASQSITVPLNTVYMAIAAMILSWVLVWVAGSKIGQRRAEDQLRRDLGSLPTTLPPKSDPVVDRDASHGSKPDGGARVLPGPTGSGPFITSKGRVEGDPRQPGLNYLAVATVPAAEADRAVPFLKEKGGLEAVGIPVDPADGRTNNLRYKLVVLVGVSKDQLNEKAAAMAELRRTVEQLGPQWQKAYPGGSNFRSSVWEKYQP